MKDKRIGYICATDFNHELEVEIAGKDTYPRIYPSIKEAQRHRKCLDPNTRGHCGIYKVQIIKQELVQADDLP